jgi:hypothetical protein
VHEKNTGNPSCAHLPTVIGSRRGSNMGLGGAFHAKRRAREDGANENDSHAGVPKGNGERVIRTANQR